MCVCVCVCVCVCIHFIHAYKGCMNTCFYASDELNTKHSPRSALLQVSHKETINSPKSKNYLCATCTCLVVVRTHARAS